MGLTASVRRPKGSLAGLISSGNMIDSEWGSDDDCQTIENMTAQNAVKNQKASVAFCLLVVPMAARPEVIF
jgi:hypothetical protein